MFNLRNVEKVYPKNSFDRFGEDLTELIVSYLWFEDKVRLECVSKQWRRLVFNKQFGIELDTNPFIKNNNKDCLKMFGLLYRGNQLTIQSVLKKCPNIINVKINLKEVSSQVLSLIVHYCHRIKSLTYCCYIARNDINVLSFFRICGQKLEELIISDGCETTIEECLKFCPNLEKLKIPYNSILFKENKEFLPKLQEMSSDDDCTVFCSEDAIKMNIWVNKYSMTLKKLKVNLFGLSEKQLKTSIECISRFENLTELKLKIESVFRHPSQPLEDSLILIGQKCTKLLKLELFIYYSVPISEHFFDIFTEFKAIKVLKIMLFTLIPVKGSIESLKYCKQLKHLDIHYSELKEDFFSNIQSFVPNLQFLKITTTTEFSDSFFYSLHSMKTIQKVIQNEFNKCKYWYFGKQLSEVMSSSIGKYVIRVNHNCGHLRPVSLVDLP